ncbi:MAG: hypothetical protein FJ253_02795 [Phycisphaerae bacterium]|nr:hypothetical protein [Phycisphaerae bacterium]
MARPLARFLSALQLVRLSLALGAVGELWFAVLLARADPQAAGLAVSMMPLPEALGIATIVAIGLYSFGASLNDVLDLRHDSAFSPERPIPSGKIRSAHAVMVAMTSLMVAVSGAVLFGQSALLTTVVIAAVILFFNAAGKHFPAVGLLVVGMVHAGHMLIPDQRPATMLPAWLAMVHAVAVRAVVHRLEEKRPALTARSILALLLLVVGASVMLLSRGGDADARARLHAPALTSLLWPVASVALFVIVAWAKTRRVPSTTAAEKLLRYGSLWQVVHGVAWMAMLGEWSAAGWLALLALGGFATMTILRESASLVLRPPEYRP